jgi:hypothetical protein
MKKNWKCWLGTVAAAMLGGSVMAQAPQYPAAGPDFGFDGEGSIRMGTESGSAVATPAQYPGYQPVDADAIWQEAPRAYQGAPPPQDDSVGFASATSFADVQYRVGRVNNDQYGFQGGYTTLNAFIPIATDGMNMWFFDPRLNITDFGEGAASLGLGYRRYSPSMDRIFGISGWYDYDPGHRGEYSQAGLSLENIGRYFSTRFNANVPFEDSNQYTTANSFGTPFFQGNNIAYLFNFLREITYQQYQLEAAAPIPFLGRYGGEWALSAYGLVGGDNASKDALGIAGRFEFQVSEDFWINTIVSHDRIFGTNTSINFELTIPSGVQTRWLRPKKVQDKLLASVKRPYRVSTNTVSLQETQFFLDQRDGNPIVVAHIDPTAANGAASGSVTNPFGSVADYMADPNRADFDIIFVGRNALATDDTDLNTGIELLTGQRLLGTGALADGSVHEFHFIDRGDGVTTLDLPGFANGTAQSTGPNPFLTNSAAPVGTPVVSINGNITEVSGFTIDASGTADGISTPFATAVDGFVITNNTFQNAIDAVDITSNTSAVLGFDTTLPPSRFGGENFGIVTSNTINGTGALPVTNGIVIDHIAGTGAEDLNLLIGQNTINGVTNIGINVSALGGTLDGNDPAFGLQSNIIDSTGQGILATSTGIGTVFNLSVQGNQITNSTNIVDPLNPELGAGMGFLAQAGSQMNFNVVSDNVVTNAGGAGGRGAAFVAESAGIMTFSPIVAGQSAFFQNTFSGNADDGALFSADGAGSNVFMNSTVIGNTFTNNGGNGVNLQASNSGTVTMGPFVGNTISGNTENGINGLATTNGTVNVQVGSNLAGTTSLINGNTLNGVNFESALGGTMNVAIQNVTSTANGLSGVRLASSGGTTNAFIDGTAAANNNFVGNVGDGMSVVSTLTGTVNIDSLTNTTIANNGNDGIDVNLSGGSTVTFADISGTTVSGNTAFGMRVNGSGTSTFNLTMGASAATNGQNLFDNNADAGVGISLINSATANIDVTNSTFSNTRNTAADTTFNGDGFHVRLVDTATLPNATFGDPLTANTLFLNNAGSGLALFTDGDAAINNPLVQNVTFTNNGTVEGNAINGGIPVEGDAGFRLIRQGNGIVNNVVITDSRFTQNANGILATARNGDLTDEYTITNNTITNQDFRGIALRAEFDADITALIQGNTISNNGNEGIQTTERRNSSGDSLNVSLQVFDNLIESNGQNGVADRGQGIEISAAHFTGVTIGSVGNPFPDNTIRGNSGDGIEINQSGTAVIANNLIEGNGGEAGIDLNAGVNSLTVTNNVIRANAADGIELSSLGLLTTQMNVAVAGNLIEANGQDGIEIVSQTVANNTVTIDTGNIIQDNIGRGVAIFNRGNGADFTTRLTVNLNNNTIQRNQEEGVYVVNTSSTTQSTDAASTVIMDATGSVFADPRLIFNMSGNNVRDNGVLSGFTGTGLVVRVGTSDASQSITDPGGFANTRGGVTASVIGNSLGGNAGSDVYFESFTSTVNPTTTAGQWTDGNENPRNDGNNIFNITNTYQSDPLARLDLTFNNNVGEELDASNPGAFYNNDESVFKSRTRAQDGNDPNGPFPGTPDDDGPFGSGTRQRNAQRLAFRGPLPPTIAAGSQFLFSGMGESTFRISAAGNAFGTVTTPFFLDTDPYTNPFTDASGVLNGGGGPLGVDFMPYGWSTLP